MKIQSQSDIITNSSSEVFIMPLDDANRIEEKYNTSCISVNEIDWDYVVNYSYEIEKFAEILDVANGEYYEDYMDDNEKEAFLKEMKEKFDKKFRNGKYAWIDIEDHFTDCEDAYDDARAVCIWSEYRH